MLDLGYLLGDNHTLIIFRQIRHWWHHKSLGLRHIWWLFTWIWGWPYYTNHRRQDCKFGNKITVLYYNAVPLPLISYYVIVNSWIFRSQKTGPRTTQLGLLPQKLQPVMLSSHSRSQGNSQEKHKLWYVSTSIDKFKGLRYKFKVLFEFTVLHFWKLVISSISSSGPSRERQC